MTIIFKYSKDGEEARERILFELVSPTDKYFGVDLTELDIEEQGQFVAEATIIIEQRNAEIALLMEKYDIKHKYRYFYPEKMTNVVFE